MVEYVAPNPKAVVARKAMQERLGGHRGDQDYYDYDSISDYMQMWVAYEVAIKALEMLTEEQLRNLTKNAMSAFDLDIAPDLDF